MVCPAPSALARGGGRLGQTEFTSEADARGYVPADLPIVPVAPRLHEHRGSSPGVRRLRPRSYLASTPAGALSGKVVYLSPGHGFVYTAANGWGTQRPNLFGVVEDLSNQDGVAEFLVPYLLAAGAQVVSVRELDPNPQMVIVDDSDGAARPEAGKYLEIGDAALFSDSTAPGWGQAPLPLSGTTNPFAAGGNRLLQTSPSETARATYVLQVPEARHYLVYISYSMHSSRPSDAEVIVSHPGGDTTFLVDQRRHGGTWVLLGRFYFEAGADDARGAVSITNRSHDPGSFASADAVRIGGGMGLTERNGGTSNLVRADECSRYHAQFSGAPATVYDPSTKDDRTDDISTRSRFADWHHAQGEQAIYLSHHSNAFNGAIRGTESYVYGPNPPNGSMQPTDEAVALGSVELANAVHGEVIADIRAELDPGWPDRKVKSAYFGEINPANQDEMASMLIEIAFHDQVDDAALLKDARFRRLAARAMYKGIVKYFAQVDGVEARLLPEPPQALLARNIGPGRVLVSWQPPAFGGVYGDPATTYRVYRSASGHAFDGGADTGGEVSLELTGLSPGEVLYLRVTALNAGGESLPSATLAVGVGAASAAPAVLVAGYERLDPEINVRRAYPGLDLVDRLLLDQMNNGSYLVQHGRALASSGVPFDACTRDAVDGAAVDLAGYQMIIWQAGRGTSAERGLTAASRDALASAASAGAAVVISGTTVARTLALGAPEDQTLLSGVLGTRFVTATERLGTVTPEASGAWAGLQPFTLAGSAGLAALPYDIGVPEVLAAEGPGAAVMASYGASQGAAMQLKEGTRCGVLLGFPLEAVVPPQRQTELLGRVIDLCGVEVPAGPDGGVPPTDGDGGIGGDTGGGDDGGCSCAVDGGPGPLGLLLALLTLVALARRRRR